MPEPAREGRDGVVHRFELNSSGLLGEELPGRWLTCDEAIAKYRLIFFKYRLLGDKSLARKIVRRIRTVRSGPHAWLASYGLTDVKVTKPYGVGRNKIYDAMHRRFAAHWFDTRLSGLSIGGQAAHPRRVGELSGFVGGGNCDACLNSRAAASRWPSAEQVAYVATENCYPTQWDKP